MVGGEVATIGGSVDAMGITGLLDGETDGLTEGYLLTALGFKEGI